MGVIFTLLQVTQFLRRFQQNTTYPNDISTQLVSPLHEPSLSI